MDPLKRKFDEIDPDYIFPEVKKRKITDKEDKSAEIIKREFANEIAWKEKELEEIQDRLKVAMKTLQLLRSVCIQTYYNRKDLVTQPFQDVDSKLLDPQVDTIIGPESRPHPAVRKIIGKAPLQFEPCRMRKRKVTSINLKNSIPSITSTVSSNPQTEHPIKELQAESTSVAQISNTRESQDTEGISRIGRFKRKHRIIVGNISKWLNPSSTSQDLSTHKWMVYVRGPKDNPDVSNIVKKVRFFLHPSYRPNDIVEIRNAPFHISRRGWGEFPLRVQIHFLNNLNKPVDVIHNLKLDHTHTGLQTLGRETLIDVWLFMEPLHKLASVMRDRCEANVIKNEIQNGEDSSHDDIDISETQFIAHNGDSSSTLYQQGNVVVKGESLIKNNSENDLKNGYCYFPESNNEVTNKSVNCIKVLNPIQYSPSPVLDPLIQPVSLNEAKQTFFDPSSPTKPNCITGAKIKTPPKIPSNEVSTEKIIYKNGKICLLKNKTRSSSLKPKGQVSLLKTCVTKQGISLLKKSCAQAQTENRMVVTVKTLQDIHNYCRQSNAILSRDFPVVNYDKFTTHCTRSNFHTVTAALIYLLRHLPLVTELAAEPFYLKLFPYVAHTQEEFLSWNNAKQYCSEWFRAKYIKTILTNNDICGYNKWSVKSIIQYARLTGFGITALKNLANKTIPNTQTSKPSPLQSFTESSELCQWLPKLSARYQSDDEEINIIDTVVAKKVDEPKEQDPTSSLSVYIALNEVPEIPRLFIQEIVADIGIPLKSEEIIPDVWCSAAEMCLIVAAKNFIEDIIRRSCANRKLNEQKTEINLQDVQAALVSRSEFEILLNTGLGKIPHYDE